MCAEANLNSRTVPLFEAIALRDGAANAPDMLQFKAADKIFVYGVYLSNVVYLVDAEVNSSFTVKR
jgi:hypothetical protein